MNYDEIIQSALKEVEDSNSSEKLEQLRIKYFGKNGTFTIALKSLSKLYENQFNIKFVVSQAPKPSGRGKRISDSPVGDFAKKKMQVLSWRFV